MITHYHNDRKHGVMHYRHGPGEVAESYIHAVGRQKERKRDTGPRVDFRNLKAHSQRHTYYKTASNLSQTVSQLMTKYLNIWACESHSYSNHHILWA